MASSRFGEYFTEDLRAVNKLSFFQIGDLQRLYRELQRQLRLAEEERDRANDAVRHRDQQVTCPLKDSMKVSERHLSIQI